MAPVNQSARVVTGDFPHPGSSNLPQPTKGHGRSSSLKASPCRLDTVSVANRDGITGMITLWRQIDNERVPNSTKVKVDPRWSKERAIKAIQSAMTKGEAILKTLSEDGEYHRAIFPNIKTFFKAEWDKIPEGSKGSPGPRRARGAGEVHPVCRGARLHADRQVR